MGRKKDTELGGTLNLEVSSIVFCVENVQAKPLGCDVTLHAAQKHG